MDKFQTPENYASTLDDIDYEILRLLRQNSRMSAKNIAEKVFLSSTSVAKRIENMVNEGVISGFDIHIDPMSLGFYTRAFINVEVEPSQKDSFYPYIDNIENVIQCSCVTGDYSMLLEVMFHNTMELDYFIGELHKYGKTKTLIVFSTPIEHRECYWSKPL